MTKGEVPGAAPKGPWTCPNCGKSGAAETRPFCSTRCANLDLGRWLDGGYVLPGSEHAAPPETDEDGAY